jgi:hypothetical protein
MEFSSFDSFNVGRRTTECTRVNSSNVLLHCFSHLLLLSCNALALSLYIHHLVKSFHSIVSIFSNNVSPWAHCRLLDSLMALCEFLLDRVIKHTLGVGFEVLFRSNQSVIGPKRCTGECALSTCLELVFRIAGRGLRVRLVHVA